MVKCFLWIRCEEFTLTHSDTEIKLHGTGQFRLGFSDQSYQSHRQSAVMLTSVSVLIMIWYKGAVYCRNISELISIFTHRRWSCHVQVCPVYLSLSSPWTSVQGWFPEMWVPASLIFFFFFLPWHNLLLLVLIWCLRQIRCWWGSLSNPVADYNILFLDLLHALHYTVDRDRGWLVAQLCDLCIKVFHSFQCFHLCARWTLH